MRTVLKFVVIISLGLTASITEAKKSKVELAKELAAEIARSEAWNKAKEKAKEVYAREKKCKNTQGGNNANSTAAVRVC